MRNTMGLTSNNRLEGAVMRLPPGASGAGRNCAPSAPDRPHWAPRDPVEIAGPRRP